MSEPNPHVLDKTRDELIRTVEGLVEGLKDGMPLHEAKTLMLSYSLRFLKTIAECAVGIAYDLRAIRKKLESQP